MSNKKYHKREQHLLRKFLCVIDGKNHEIFLKYRDFSFDTFGPEPTHLGFKCRHCRLSQHFIPNISDTQEEQTTWLMHK